MLVERKDDPQSLQRGVALLEQAASAETPYAWTALGDLHLDGAFPGADPAKGVAYLERAHKAGIPSATARLGEIGRAPSELQSLMRISYAVFCLKKKKPHT